MTFATTLATDSSNKSIRLVHDSPFQSNEHSHFCVTSLVFWFNLELP